uniref:Uncharacterized protein n=1 Tax=Oryza glaberrima TaxID=4538 RepID=A0A679BDB3_ORYGL|nr:hypothetical protein [Oryza glaberrima]BBF89480.1 hypothetical protein [Oryza glaberrima]
MAPRRSPVLVAETTGGGGSALTGSGAAEAAQGDGAVAETVSRCPVTAWPPHLPVLPSCRRAILRVPDSSTPTTADSRRSIPSASASASTFAHVAPGRGPPLSPSPLGGICLAAIAGGLVAPLSLKLTTLPDAGSPLPSTSSAVN